MISQLLAEYLFTRKQAGLYRQRHLDAASYDLNFSSNDYLSLSNHLPLQKAFQKGFNKYPAGSGGSAVVSGYHPLHRELENAFSQALGVDDALLFTSGYTANLSVISLFAQLEIPLLLDKAAHASFYDGIQLSKASYIRFRHNDTEHLASLLQSQVQHPLIITEGIFSMSGQRSPLAALHACSEKNQGALIVDEAHSFGILGPNGLGAVAATNLTQNEVPLRIIPLGKAFGAQGAIVAGNTLWIDALLQSARPYIYSTAMSPAVAYGLLQTFYLLQASQARREKLFQLIRYFQKKVQQSSLLWRDSNTPIQQLMLGCPHRALAYTEKLKQGGIFCQAMRPPTVLKKETGLRIILNYHHQKKDLDNLFFQLNKISETI